MLGKPIRVSLELAGGGARFFNGYCSRISQGNRDELFTRYRLEVVPALWFLSKNVQTRIFQQKSVPDILKKVLENLDVKWELTGKFEPRDYCVQYAESDFAFVSRLMEEEGMYYFFTHTDSENKMVVADSPQSHRISPRRP